MLADQARFYLIKCLSRELFLSKLWCQFRICQEYFVPSSIRTGFWFDANGSEFRKFHLPPMQRPKFDQIRTNCKTKVIWLWKNFNIIYGKWSNKKSRKIFNCFFLTLNIVFVRLTMGFYVHPFRGQTLHNFRPVDTWALEFEHGRKDL